jgi:hypothetical protein
MVSHAPWKKMKALLSEAAPAYRYRLLPLPWRSRQILAPGLADRDAVKRHVVVHGVGVGQAVVGDDLDAGLAGSLGGCGGGLAVLRGSGSGRRPW